MSENSRRMVSGGFCRRRWGEGWFGFVAIGFLLTFSSAFGFALNTNNNGIAVGVQRQNFSDSATQDSYDISRREIRVGRKPLSYLHDGEWEKERGFLKRKESHRKLQNDGNKTGQDNMISTNTTVNINDNRTMIDEDVAVIISRAVIGLNTALGAMAILISILSWGFVYLYRNNTLVAIGQPPFLYLVCFGSLLISSEIFFLFRYKDISGTSFEEQSTLDTTCVIELWFRNIGSVCVHMAIFCKLWRANKVSQFRRNLIILPKHVIVPFVAMLLAVIALTIAQTILDPPKWRVPVLDLGEINANGTAEETASLTNVATCMSSGINAWNVALENQARPGDAEYVWIEITEFLLSLLSLIIMLYMAFVTRKIPEDISDSRQVFRTVFVSLGVTVAMFGLYWLGRWINNYTLSVIARSLGFFFHATVYVGFLVMPKIYSVWRDQHNKGQQQSKESQGPSMINSKQRGKRTIYVSGISTRTPSPQRGRKTIRVTGLNPTS